jgi:hypothetical protein
MTGLLKSCHKIIYAFDFAEAGITMAAAIR